VAVSLVDTHRAIFDIEVASARVIGDRLPARRRDAGASGAADAPSELADYRERCAPQVGRRRGTGFLALSDRALERLHARFRKRLFPPNNGRAASPLDGVPLRPHQRRAITPSGARSTRLRFAGAPREIDAVGVPAISARLVEKCRGHRPRRSALPVHHPGAENDAGGDNVIEPAADQFTVPTVSLFNHGVNGDCEWRQCLCLRNGRPMKKADALRAAFMNYASAITV
jgi:hypothetical protein